MSTAENKATYKRFIDEILNGRDLSAVPRYTPANFVDHRHHRSYSQP
jgi:hypothetical protein